MYCGFLKKECNDLTVGELIDILEPYRNAKVKIQNNDTFYIHFDQSGDYINLNNLSLERAYGMSSTKCKNCELMDKETKKCGCTGEHCVTLEAFRANDKVEQPQEVHVEPPTEEYPKTNVDDEFDNVVKVENLIEKMGEEASNINSILKAIKSLTSANSKKSTIISTEDMDVIIITKDK